MILGCEGGSKLGSLVHSEGFEVKPYRPSLLILMLVAIEDDQRAREGGITSVDQGLSEWDTCFKYQIGFNVKLSSLCDVVLMLGCVGV